MKKFQNIAFLFPGQGAQAVGMGRDFYDNFPIARETFQEADDLLKKNLSKILFEGPQELLTETKISQPAIYVMSLAVLRVLQSQFPELKPSVCAGLSLGEYTALTAAGYLSFSSALPLVQERGELMNAACLEIPGTMAAIFGLSAEAVEQMVQELHLPRDLWTANFNCPGQTVISGTVKGVEAGIQEAKARGAKRAIPLKVHGGFHSGLMRSAEDKLKEKIELLDLVQSDVALAMNATGEYAVKKETVRENLMRQITSSVRWEQGIRAMMRNQVDLFLEIGCGKVLTGLNRQINVSAPAFNIGIVSDLDVFSKFFNEEEIECQDYSLKK